MHNSMCAPDSTVYFCIFRLCSICQHLKTQALKCQIKWQPLTPVFCIISRHTLHSVHRYTIPTMNPMGKGFRPILHLRTGWDSLWGSLGSWRSPKSWTQETFSETEVHRLLPCCNFCCRTPLSHASFASLFFKETIIFPELAKHSKFHSTFRNF